MRHLLQPPRSRICGQVCLAMALGKPLRQVHAVAGYGKTSYSVLVRTANLLGCALGPTVRRTNKHPAPGKGLYIARVLWNRRYRQFGHFIVIKDGRVYDPLQRPSVLLNTWLDLQRQRKNLPELTITSWVQVLWGG